LKIIKFKGDTQNSVVLELECENCNNRSTLTTRDKQIIDNIHNVHCEECGKNSSGETNSVKYNTKNEFSLWVEMTALTTGIPESKIIVDYCEEHGVTDAEIKKLLNKSLLSKLQMIEKDVRLKFIRPKEIKGE